MTATTLPSDPCDDARAQLPTIEDVDRLRAEPGFAHAMTRLSTDLLVASRRRQLTTKLMGERALLAGVSIIFYLHHAPAFGAAATVRLTPARFADILERIGMASRGRATAMLALFRWAGHLEPVGAVDGRQRPLAPTPRLLELQRERIDIFTRSIRRLPLTLASVTDPDPVLASLVVAAQGEFIARGITPIFAAPELDWAMDRSGVLMLLLALRRASDAAEPLSIKSLADETGLSRAHVRAFLKEAETRGLMEAGRPGRSLIVAHERLLAAGILLTDQAFQKVERTRRSSP